VKIPPAEFVAEIITTDKEDSAEILKV